MIVEIKTITGWKWDTLPEVSEAEVACLEYFDLPLGDTNITTGVLGVIPNYNVRGVIEFYYVGYEFPSQLNQVPALGDPYTFDITIIIE
jgi:hypothetical protein